MSAEKIEKPYPDFPLTAHYHTQRWCKKIKGKVHYFGPLADWEGALQKYLDQRDDLYAGRKPRTTTGGATLAQALNGFLSAKKLLEDSGEIKPRTYLDYEKTCDKIDASIGKNRSVASLDASDLEKLRADFAKGKLVKKRGPTAIKGDLTRARMVFLYINENDYVSKPIQYRKILKSPSARSFRILANERGERLFSRDELKIILGAASPTLAAMIYLAINCGFGNEDCGLLPFSELNLDTGWHTFWRPKTHTPRRCPLWKETVTAIRASIEVRPKPASKAVKDLVFLTNKGRCWCREDTGDNAISSEIRKLLKKLKIYRKNVTTFYSGRRTFETISAPCGHQVAIDHIMGHLSTEMSAVYRQKTFDGPLRKVTDHVHDWFTGAISIE